MESRGLIQHAPLVYLLMEKERTQGVLNVKGTLLACVSKHQGLVEVWERKTETLIYQHKHSTADVTAPRVTTLSFNRVLTVTEDLGQRNTHTRHWIRNRRGLSDAC